MIFHRTILTAQRDNKFANRISSGHVASEKQSSEERCSTFVHTHTHTRITHTTCHYQLYESSGHTSSRQLMWSRRIYAVCMSYVTTSHGAHILQSIYLPMLYTLTKYGRCKRRNRQPTSEQVAAATTTQHTAKTFLNISHAYNVYRKRWRNYFVIYHPFVLYKGLLRDQRDRINIIIFLSIYLSRSRKIDSRIEEQIKKNTHILRARTTF